MRVVVDARPAGHEPRIRDGELLLDEVRMVLDLLRVVEGVGLAVVVVAGAQHLLVQPGRVDLVARGRPPELRLEGERVVVAAVWAALHEKPTGAEAAGIGREHVERRLVEQSHEPRPGRVERPGLPFENRADDMPRIGDGVVRLPAGPEVARGEDMVDARAETLVDVQVPGQGIGRSAYPCRPAHR